MEILATLMQGFTPILLFIFICLVALLIMFYGAMRGLDEMVKGIRDERAAISDQMTGIKLRLEDMVHFQSEISCLLRQVLGGEAVSGLPLPPPLAEQGPEPEAAEAELPALSAASDEAPAVEIARPAAEPALDETVALGAAGALGLALAAATLGKAKERHQVEATEEIAVKALGDLDDEAASPAPEAGSERFAALSFRLADDAPIDVAPSEEPGPAEALPEEAPAPVDATLELDGLRDLEDLDDEPTIRLDGVDTGADSALDAKLDLVTGLEDMEPEPALPVKHLAADLDDTLVLDRQETLTLNLRFAKGGDQEQAPAEEEPAAPAAPDQEREAERIPTLDELFLEDQVATAAAEMKKSAFGEIDPLTATLPGDRPLPELNFEGLRLAGLEEDTAEKARTAANQSVAPAAEERIQPKDTSPTLEIEPVFFLSEEDQEEREERAGSLEPDAAAHDLAPDKGGSGLGDLSTLEDITFDDILPEGGQPFEAVAQPPAQAKDEEDLSLEHDIAALEDILNMDDEGGVHKAREKLAKTEEPEETPAPAKAEPAAQPATKTGKTQDNILDFILED